MRSILDALVTEKTLSLISTRRNSALLDLIADDQVEHNVPLKNVCAKVSPQLAEQIDEVVGLLGISKRRFLEAAFIEAVSKAQEIMLREGLWEALDDDQAEDVPAAEKEGA